MSQNTTGMVGGPTAAASHESELDIRTRQRDWWMEDRNRWKLCAENAEKERDEAVKQQRYAWERHAEKDQAYGQAIAERDEWRAAAEIHQVTINTLLAQLEAARKAP